MFIRWIIMMVCAMLVFGHGNAEADEWWNISYPESEFSIAYGVDIKHSNDDNLEDDNLDDRYYEVRYRSQLFDLETENVDSQIGWAAYAGAKNTIGLGLYGTFGPFLAGVGVESADEDELTSTQGGYELMLEWRFHDDFALSLKHRSNCKYVCEKVPFMDVLPHGSDSTHNRGWNYLTLRYNF